ncbi:hypothetical protein QCA50_018990 [Cerrena zonata]|uniref:Thioesterase domain-containing protein n=1 Tax=Cerrena zonata TaxID=2478898 RepID=A0AAW0FGL4_9APHY
MSNFESRLASEKAWVDPHTLPKYGDASDIAGNAPDEVKQLTNNTLGAYGVGDPDCFAHGVGKAIVMVELNVYQRGNKWESKAMAEVVVAKDMLNGAGAMHGGALCYIIDNCASLPLVALGVMQGGNGVGVSQVLNVFFHSPATLGSQLCITNTSVTLGGRVMTSKCEVVEKSSGKMIASALLSKMQPTKNKL